MVNGKNLHLLFVDLKKTYVCKHRESLLRWLKEFRIYKKLLNPVEMYVSHIKANVKLGNKTNKELRLHKAKARRWRIVVSVV